ncbi:glycoside hydrolase family 18 protein [Mycena albidolilacea]|uniref:Glycoside hydrolase family 18 protein n=1 Tax=Mycena albidolilacea TaxID=1033008 RepID=A0AAD7EHF6_9AGAR|nr:glycoside hydrolase family 18 protein [Mycena albidolilacea]
MYQFLHLTLLFLCAQSVDLVQAAQYIHKSRLHRSHGIHTGSGEVIPRVSGGPSKPIASGWYADWSGVALAKILWAKYTHMAYAFAIPTNDPTNITVDAKGLTDFVTTAMDNVCSINIIVVIVYFPDAVVQNVSPLLAMEGWTGPPYFSTAVSTEENRESYSYFGHQLSFGRYKFRELHKQNESMPVTAAVSGPFLGKDGNPMKDVSAFADVLNRIGVSPVAASTVVGPNAPLNASCAPLAYQKFGSVESMVNARTRVNSAAETDNTIQPYPTISGPFAVPTPTPIPDKCGAPSSISGMSTFSDLVNTGYLDSTGNASTLPGIVYTIDTCSQTPFIYNYTSSVMVSYDDATSFAAKGKYIVDNGLAGFAVWDAAGDYKGILLDSVRKATGMA